MIISNALDDIRSAVKSIMRKIEAGSGMTTEHMKEMYITPRKQVYINGTSNDGVKFTWCYVDDAFSVPRNNCIRGYFRYRYRSKKR